MPEFKSIEPAFVSTTNARVVAAIVKEAGFQSAQRSAFYALSELFGNYLERLLSTTHKYAEIGGHARPNYHDITRSLEEAGLPMPIFERYLVNYHTLPSLATQSLRVKRETESTEEQVPQFLPSDDEDDNTTEREISHNTLPPYVPKHLPHFPSKHSFRQTPVYIQRPDDAQKVRELNSQQSRTVEENLKRLMAAENRLSQQNSQTDPANTSSLMTIVNYETAWQRRNRKRVSGFPDYNANGQPSLSTDSKEDFLTAKSTTPMDVDTPEEPQTSSVQ